MNLSIRCPWGHKSKGRQVENRSTSLEDHAESREIWDLLHNRDVKSIGLWCRRTSKWSLVMRLRMVDDQDLLCLASSGKVDLWRASTAATSSIVDGGMWRAIGDVVLDQP